MVSMPGSQPGHKGSNPLCSTRTNEDIESEEVNVFILCGEQLLVFIGKIV